jgi:NADPH:quinone reductase-like Zn-dependent oxidoreductase
MSKIVLFDQPGAAEVQRIKDVAVVAPGPHDVQIRVQTIGLNRSDLIYRCGAHPLQPPLPSCNGAEAAGIVTAVGAEVGKFIVGDAVAVMPHMDPERGTYGELINVAAARVMHAAPELSTLENAAFWASYLTAYGGLIQVGKLTRGDFVILPAASSSIGLAAVQIANAIGAHAIALTRDQGKIDRLLSAGARAAFLSGSDNLAEQLRECTHGRGARVVFDPVGGHGTAILADAISRCGTYVIYGAMSGEVTPFPVATAFEKLLTMTVFRLDFINRPQELPEARAFLVALLGKGLLKPTIDKVFAFDEVVAAHLYMESNRQFGKVVLRV